MSPYTGLLVAGVHAGAVVGAAIVLDAHDVVAGQQPQNVCVSGRTGGNSGLRPRTLRAGK